MQSFKTSLIVQRACCYTLLNISMNNNLAGFIVVKKVKMVNHDVIFFFCTGSMFFFSFVSGFGFATFLNSSTCIRRLIAARYIKIGDEMVEIKGIQNKKTRVNNIPSNSNKQQNLQPVPERNQPQINENQVMHKSNIMCNLPQNTNGYHTPINQPLYEFCIPKVTKNFNILLKHNFYLSHLPTTISSKTHHLHHHSWHHNQIIVLINVMDRNSAVLI